MRRRDFLRGALSCAAAALAMPTALPDLDEEVPEVCACKYGLPCDKGPWYNHYAHAPQFRGGITRLRAMTALGAGKTAIAAAQMYAKMYKEEGT